MVACWLVGVVVTGRAPDQPAGWAFLGLGTALAWSAFCDDYSELGRLGDRDVPAWKLFATLGDTSFVWWFVFLALVLLYTPPGPRRGVARWLPTVTVVCRGRVPGHGPAAVHPARPAARGALQPAGRPGHQRGGGVPGSRGHLHPRRVPRLPRSCCWCAPGVVPRESPGGSCSGWWPARCPLAPAVIAAFAVSVADHTEVAVVILGAAMVALVVGAGLSVLRYRLYDVERVVTESAAYAIASAAVLVVYIGVVVVVSRSGPVDAGSQLTTIAATLAGVGAARVSYVWGRRAVGRRVNPSRFNAVEAVRAGLTRPSADLDELVATALGGRARVVYPAAGGAWVTSDGRAVEPSADGVDVRRHERSRRPPRVRPARERARCRRSGRPRGSGRDGQRGAACRAGPAGRAHPRVAGPAVDRPPRGAPSHRAGPARRCAAAPARHRPAAAVGPAQRRRRGARRRDRPRDRGPAGHRAGAAHPRGRAAARGPRRRWAAGRRRRPRRPGARWRSPTTWWTSASRPTSRAPPGSWSPRR